LTRAGDLRAAIRIDAVIGSREIVVKSVGPQVSSVPGMLGATIMGDGSVLIILDLAPLVRHGITVANSVWPMGSVTYRHRSSKMCGYVRW
jgi:chemosensory pili system protein ChpA (sensor histidine kinase/response regulator)